MLRKTKIVCTIGPAVRDPEIIKQLLIEGMQDDKTVNLMKGETITLTTEEVEGTKECIIRQGGAVGSRKNVNVIGIRTALPAITEKDKQDILFGIEHNVDFIAASFVRRGGQTFLKSAKFPPVNNSVLLIGIAPDFSLVAQQEEHLCAPPHQL